MKYQPICPIYLFSHSQHTVQYASGIIRGVYPFLVVEGEEKTQAVDILKNNQSIVDGDKIVLLEGSEIYGKINNMKVEVV